MLIRFFFNDTATTEIYTLSLHDALPIDTWAIEHQGSFALAVVKLAAEQSISAEAGAMVSMSANVDLHSELDRKSTRLNSSHANISYAVFCLKKNNLFLDKSILLRFFITL